MDIRQPFEEPDDLVELGRLIDAAADRRSVSVQDELLSRLDTYVAVQKSPKIISLAHYFRSNIYASKSDISGETRQWTTARPNWLTQVRELRHAVRHVGFRRLHPLRQSAIYTNLGNSLNNVTRYIEALGYWNRALDIVPNFSMPLGNKGLGLAYYAGATYDGGHSNVLLREAAACLDRATGPDAIYETEQDRPRIRTFFRSHLHPIVAHVEQVDARNIVMTGFSLGLTEAEQRYRQWALDRTLFLNDLNDATKQSIASADTLGLPTIVTVGSDDPPPIFGFFNQMVQEFVAARLFYYEGAVLAADQYADQNVHLVDTLDSPIYSISAERMRCSYRLAYSVLDKVAFFLNDYFELGMAPRAVNFRAIWDAVRPDGRKLTDLDHGLLHALYWLSKDVREDGFDDVSEPEAVEMFRVRNALEHRYLQLYQDPDRMPPSEGLRESLHKDVFDQLALRLLRLARSSLIYLSFAVHAEERRREAQDLRRRGVSRKLPPYRRSRLHPEAYEG